MTDALSGKSCATVSAVKPYIDPLAGGSAGDDTDLTKEMKVYQYSEFWSSTRTFLIPRS